MAQQNLGARHTQPEEALLVRPFVPAFLFLYMPCPCPFPPHPRPHLAVRTTFLLPARPLPLPVQ